jgi:hypothetical protein
MESGKQMTVKDGGIIVIFRITTTIVINLIKIVLLNRWQQKE